MNLRLPALFSALALLAPATFAQDPPSLVGAWQMQQISFVASRPLSHEMQEQLDDSTIAALNLAMRQGATRLLVEFRPDGTYQFGQYEGPRPAWTETGTYRVAGGVLYGVAPGAPHGSSFEQHRIVELTRRRLVLEFPFGADSLQIAEQVEYRRRPPAR